MVRLHFVVEGQTEERFVKRVLVAHLAAMDVFVDVRAVETSHDRRKNKIYRGGLLDYQRAKKDLKTWMQEDQQDESWFTTMFDLYALPDTFPGMDRPRDPDPHRRVNTLEAAFANDIEHRRLVPYIQLHEFEALLFSDPSKLKSTFLDRTAAVRELVALASTFATPELIDDGQATAPSKRIIAHIPEYDDQKADAGPKVAEAIGLDVLRTKCTHFGEWLARIEGLAG